MTPVKNRRTDGKYKTARQYIGPDGLPVKKEFVQKKGETVKQVIARADKWKVESLGKIPSPDIKFEAAFELYVKYREKQGRADKTIKDLNFVLSLMKPHIGAVKIGNLKAGTIDDMLSFWSDKPRTALKVRVNGKAAYSYFIKKGWVQGNPFQESEPVSYKSDEWDEPIPTEHFETALKLADNPVYRAMLLLLRYTGCRPIAARTLTWAELKETSDGMWMKKRAKTDASDRPVPVPKIAADAIKALPKDSIFVFPIDGKPMSDYTISKYWIRLQRKAGLTPRKLYDLRHMRLTELAMLGLTGKQLAYLGGHENVATTEKYYVQIDRKALAEKIGM